MNIFKMLFGGNGSADLRSIIEGGAYLVDVRTPGEFAGGHVKGSVNIPLDKVAGSLSKFKDKPTIVVFCKSGGRSSMAKSILNKNGIDNVVNGGTWERVQQFVK